MTVRTTIGVTLVVTAAVALGAGAVAAGQARGAPAPLPARAIAPIDLTGSWVSVVNKEWRFRMVIPAKGDFFGVIGGIPINAEARRAAEAWDPARDEAAGEACRGFGAAGLMRVPGRLRITWQDAATLRVDTDAGMQTRLFRFASSAVGGAGPASRATPRGEPAGRPTWQGDSVARWLGVPVGAAGSRQGVAPPSTAGPRHGSLEVVTTNLRPGYLRRNGVPYSSATVMTEYWDLFKEPDGTDWLVITTTIVDPTYLQMPYETSPAFKREPDGSKWDPSPCSARW